MSSSAWTRPRRPSGSATIEGRRFVDLPNPGLEVGVLLDASAQHAGRTGREILTVAAMTMGLDPAGIRWMRDLLRGYADQGGTVLLSSHLLREVEVIADHLVIINAGRIVADGTPEQLRTSRSTLVRAVDIAVLSDALRAAGRQASVGADGALTTDAEPEQVGRIAARAGAVLTELRPQGDDLEELFFTLTAPDGEPDREEAA